MNGKPLRHITVVLVVAVLLAAVGRRVALAQVGGYALTSLYSFTGAADSGYPRAGLIQGADGNFYGTTAGSNGSGGAVGYGTVFKITPSGVLTTLYSFTDGTDGANPQGALVQGSDGSFYGTTQWGGDLNVNSGQGFGTIFKITASGTLTTVYSFTGAADEGYPAAGLIQAKDGNYYGTTFGGYSNGDGSYAAGTVFKMTPSGALTTLYSFTGGTDGGNPQAALLQGSDGTLCGTTVSGGVVINHYTYGTVFKITTSGALTTLYSFTAGSDGGIPQAALVQGTDGSFYGTTAAGGIGGNGTVFGITSSGALTPLHTFTGYWDGGGPNSLVLGTDGNFYGTTNRGGGLSVNNGLGFGTVFKMRPSGSLITLSSFPGGSGGGEPNGLIQGSDGDFYGTAIAAGGSSCGAIFKLSPPTGQSVFSVAFSPDGNTMADGAAFLAPTEYYIGGLIELWNVSTGKLTRTLNTAEDTGVNAVAFSPDGTTFADGGYDVLELWDASTGALLATLDSGAAGGAYSDGVFAVAFSPDGSTLAAGGLRDDDQGAYFGVLELWNVSTRTVSNTLNTSAVQVNSVAFSPDGTKLAVGGGYNGGVGVALEIWSVQSGTLLSTLKTASNYGVVSVAFSPDGKTLAAAGYSTSGGVLEFWDVATGKRLASPALAAAKYAVSSVAYSRDGKILFAAALSGGPPAADSTILAVSTTTYALMSSFAQTVTSMVTSIAVSPDGSPLAYGTLTGVVAYASTPGFVNAVIPNIVSVSPNSALAGGPATTITVVGTDFASGAQVDWNGVSLKTTDVSATELTATVPVADLQAPGTDSVTVVNPGTGGGTSNAVTVTVKSPTVTLGSLSLNVATAGGGATTISVTGSGFLSGIQVEWNGVALKTTYVSSTKLTATIPASDLTTAGSYTIAVINPGSGSVTGNTATFTVDNPAPTLSSLSPNSATAGAAGATVTLTGAKFVSASVVQWNGVALPTTYLSGTKLTATVPANDLTKAGTFNVTVVNGAPGGGVSKAATFTVNNPVPTVKSLTPASATIGGAATTVTLTGANFVPTSLVKCNGATLATVYLSATSVAATLPASDLTKTATLSLTVVTPAPGGGTSKAVSFAVINPAPTITGLSASAATAGAAALKLTVAGTGFVSGSVVRWNGAALATIFVTGTNLTATLPASDLAKSGAFNVTVVNPAPGGGTSGPAPFTVNNPVPTLLKLSQLSAAVGSANVTVTATGTGFQTTSKAQWDGVALTTTYKSASSLTFVIPKSDLVAAGTHGITVMNPTPGGGMSGSIGFIVK